MTGSQDTLARIEALAHEWRHSPVPGSGFYGQSLLNELARDAVRTTPQPAPEESA